jgi:hypothetical protein
LDVVIQVALHNAQQARMRREEQALHTNTLNSMNEGVLVTDTAAKIIYTNSAMQTLTGFNSTDLLNQAVDQVIQFINLQTQQPIPNPCLQALEQQTTVRLPQHSGLLNREQIAIPVSDPATLLRDATDRIVGSVLVLLTQETANLANPTQLDEPQPRQELAEDFLSSLSHELRTPLATMQISIQLLKLVCQDPVQHKYLALLDRACYRETDLVNDMLLLQSLIAGQYTPLVSQIDLSEWVTHPITNFFAHRELRQQLQVSVAADLPSISTDSVCLQRILKEFLDNACKYTPEAGQIEFLVTAEPAASPPTDPSGVRFVVRNSREIPASELPHLHKLFYRVPQEDPWRYAGTGLGLALVKRLVELLQGEITVTSRAGWTTFTVWLPLSLQQ